MAVTINMLNAGTMTLGSGGSTPTTRAVTRIWWSNDESDYSDCPSDNGTFNGNCIPEEKNIENTVKVEFGSDVTSIGGEAFYYCSGLTSVTIPDSVTSIEGGAFYECTSLTSVYVADLAKWCGISFANADDNPLCYAHNLYLNGERVTNLVIPVGVTSIGTYAFSGCWSLTSVTIPDSVTSIRYGAFDGCSGLTSVTFIGKTLQQVQDIEDNEGTKHYPWGIEDTSIITVA